MTHPNTACPLDYRYSCKELASLPDRSTTALYVVGGLYGNVRALRTLRQIVDAEPGAELVFNGDFNWFNIDDEAYAEVNHFVLSHSAIRGNVETELCRPEDLGCGCNYPDWIDVDTATRSDRIFSALQQTARRNMELTCRLSELPRFVVYEVAGARIAVVHGDAESLSGWGFSQELLTDRDHLDLVGAWLDDARVDVFACSHTCLPVLQRVVTRKGFGWVANNGSAGMPNFSAKRFGLVTRIAPYPSRHVEPVYTARHDAIYLEAIPLHYDHAAWISDFGRNWPHGSTAHLSYYRRIDAGPDYELAQAIRF